MTTQQDLGWLQQEAEQLKTKTVRCEELESLQLKDGTITTFTIFTDKPFGEWKKEEKGKITTKKIIPVMHKDVKKNLWLNVKNPLYGQLLELLVTGQKTFKVSTTGTQSDTRYTIVKEE